MFWWHDGGKNQDSRAQYGYGIGGLISMSWRRYCANIWGVPRDRKKRKQYNCFLFACLGVNLYTVNLSLHTGELLVGCKAVASPFDTIQGTHPSAVNAEKRKPASKQYWYPAQFPDPILNKDFFSEPVLLKHWDQALKNLTVSSRKHLLLEDKIVAHQNNLLLNTCSGILN